MSAVSIQIYEKNWSGRAVFLNIELTQTQWGLLNSNEYVGLQTLEKNYKWVCGEQYEFFEYWFRSNVVRIIKG